MRIAVVGATGLVGSVMLKVLEEGKYLPLSQISGLIPVASAASEGKELTFNSKVYKVAGMEQAISLRPDVALFSAGAKTSAQWAPVFAEAGIPVIDNSSEWRMCDHVPLVVPEINARTITKETRIIANPNCSTIQLVMALAPLHLEFGIRRLVVSTYQSVTGSGVKGLKQLENERHGLETQRAYPHPIDLNLIPQGGTFTDNAYTSEEIKLLNETRKILGDNSVQVTATVVRVPVYGGHSMTVNAEFHRDFELNRVRTLLKNTSGVVVQDDPANAEYPMPLLAQGKDEVFVGRIRRDFSQPNALNLWIVADNLRKGAATNAVQIAAYLSKFYEP